MVLFLGDYVVGAALAIGASKFGGSSFGNDKLIVLITLSRRLALFFVLIG